MQELASSSCTPNPMLSERLCFSPPVRPFHRSCTAGITPMRVMFLDALKRGVHAVLVYSMRTEAEVWFADGSRSTFGCTTAYIAASSARQEYIASADTSNHE